MAEAAEQKKNEGNAAFAAKKYDEAILLYTEAIELLPGQHIFYSNRSACFTAMEKYEEAVQDANECVKLAPTFVKGYFRLANAFMLSGELEAAEQTTLMGLKVDKDSSNMKALRRKIMNMIKVKKAAMGKKPNELSKDEIASLEELGSAHREATFELQQTKAQKQSIERDSTRSRLTTKEVKELPEGTGTYMAIGKMFLSSTKTDVVAFLENDQVRANDKIKKLSEREEYLEKKKESVLGQMREIMPSIQSR